MAANPTPCSYLAAAFPVLDILGGWVPVATHFNGYAAGVGPVAAFNVDFELRVRGVGGAAQ
jgi:hypothetical protein